MISTKLTRQMNLQHPVILAPMALAAGGALARAVSNAGGLGLIGGGYGDVDWIEAQFQLADDQPVGCGLITWTLAQNPSVLTAVLAQKPTAVFLSFGDPQPFVAQIKAANVPVICQIQTLRDAKHAIDAGADVIVAQGSEAGGHGEKRATFTLVPEVADHIAQHAPEVLLCAAGGIADGRGLAAALMLGADGVVVGSRFWASDTALVHPNMHKTALGMDGDQTIRSSVMDIARHRDWPERYTARVLKNDFTKRWHGAESGLRADNQAQAALWAKAWEDGDTNVANTFVGEATGLLQSIKPAGDILRDMVEQAEELLGKTRW